MWTRRLLALAGLSLVAAPSPGTRPSNAAAVARVDAGLVDVRVVLGMLGEQGAATGMVLAADGVVVTNNHVVRGATSIVVTDVGNHRTYRATVTGYDIRDDVALLRLVGAHGLARVPLGSSQRLRIGAPVTAVGNAGGRGGVPRAATGVLTTLHRTITAEDAFGGSERLVAVLGTSAPLQPGDSGGALVSAAGRVIGMDTAGSTGAPSGSATVGYALPINRVLRIVRAIEAGHRSAAIHVGPTAFLGVEAVQRLYFDGSGWAQGPVVAAVLPGTPAAAAGLVPGDVITSLGGSAVSSVAALTARLVAAEPGSSVELDWLTRSGTAQHAEVTLASGPAQ
ncbi:MAG TPA: trypsin-like peptidase domain-containing protein [Acidimicrobiales bacterium]|nr:trypsin-like peptidase domain-containing protein [Acidimicrobiales bacterium]